MAIHYHKDGAVTLRSDADPSVVEVLTAERVKELGKAGVEQACMNFHKGLPPVPDPDLPMFDKFKKWMDENKAVPVQLQADGTWAYGFRRG